MRSFMGDGAMMSSLRPIAACLTTSHQPPVAAPAAGLAAMLAAMWGRIAELGHDASGGQSTLAACLLAQAQRQGHTTAWVQAQHGPLYPPDLAAVGVDLAALVVVHVGPSVQAAARLRATEMLLAGGGFAFVIVDVRQGALANPAWQGRLLTLVRAHRSTVLLLSANPPTASSLGALVSLRWTSQAAPASATGRFDLRVQLGKHKAGPWHAPFTLGCTAPVGMA